MNIEISLRVILSSAIGFAIINLVPYLAALILLISSGESTFVSIVEAIKALAEIPTSIFIFVIAQQINYYVWFIINLLILISSIALLRIVN